MRREITEETSEHPKFTWSSGSIQCVAFCGNFTVIWAVIAGQSRPAPNSDGACQCVPRLIFYPGRPTRNHPVSQIESPLDGICEVYVDVFVNSRHAPVGDASAVISNDDPRSDSSRDLALLRRLVSPNKPRSLHILIRFALYEQKC